MLSPKQDIQVFFQKDKRHGVHDGNVENFPDDCLLIIPDASVESLKIAKRLEEKNIKCLVLDHHDQCVENDNIITINNQFAPNVENKYGSGTLVTHKFCQYVDSQIGKNFSKQFVDLVALSIVSDSCSLLSYENRAYLNVGLNNIKNPFYKYLVENIIKSTKVSPKDLSFNIINILNAVQRSTNQDLKRSVFECFVGERDDYKEVLKACKAEKKAQDDGVKEEMEKAEIIDTKSLVIAQTGGDNGWSGLISNKLMSKYRKPIFVIHMDENGQFKGSCRSPVPIRSLLSATNDFIYCAGHESAFGVCYYPSKEENIIKFCDNIDLNNCQNYDVLASVNVSEAQKIADDLFDWHEQYGQLYGTNLSEPMIHIKDIKTNGQYIYEMGNGSTIKLLLGDLTAIKFFCSKDYRQSIYVGQNVPLEIELIGSLQWNRYNDNVTKQIVIEYMEVKKVEKNNVSLDDIW